MLKLRVIYVISLLIAGLLIGFTAFRPMVTGAELSKVQHEQLVETEDEWIIEFDIINNEDEDINYTIDVLLNEMPYRTHPVLVRSGKSFTYIQHIYRDMVSEPVVSFTVYKEGDPAPLEQTTYYLK